MKALCQFIFSEGDHMIKGVGTDITEVERIKNNLRNDRFIKKIYSANEVDYLNKRKFNCQTAAGMFAAKEAVSKSLGTGFSNFGPCDIEILKDESDKPYVNLLNNALILANNLDITNIQVSISHIADLAIAFCVAESN